MSCHFIQSLLFLLCISFMININYDIYDLFKSNNWPQMLCCLLLKEPKIMLFIIIKWWSTKCRFLFGEVLFGVPLIGDLLLNGRLIDALAPISANVGRVVWHLCPITKIISSTSYYHHYYWSGDHQRQHYFSCIMPSI